MNCFNLAEYYFEERNGCFFLEVSKKNVALHPKGIQGADGIIACIPSMPFVSWTLWRKGA